MIYFTADTHFGHANILKYCERPFSDVDEMDKTLIKNINKTVKVNDSLYILGDFAWKYPKLYREQINCKKVFIVLGNHDKQLNFPGFEWVKDYHFMKVNLPENKHQKIAMFHYPMMTWDCRSHGSWHLYGHVHGRDLNRPNELMLDVGVDVHNYTPISLYDIEKIMKEKKQ